MIILLIVSNLEIPSKVSVHWNSGGDLSSFVAESASLG